MSLIAKARAAPDGTSFSRAFVLELEAEAREKMCRQISKFLRAYIESFPERGTPTAEQWLETVDGLHYLARMREFEDLPLKTQEWAKGKARDIAERIAGGAKGE